MLVLGVNAYHGDTSAALVADGRIIAAVEEERFTRQRHQAGFPAHSVRWVLDHAGVGPGDIDHIAVSKNPLASLPRRIAHALRYRPSPRVIRDRLTNQRRVLGIREAVATALDVDPRGVTARIHRVEHHLAHVGSAFYCSPFDTAACLSVDGMGDLTSMMWGQAAGTDFRPRGRVGAPDSLGIFYTAFTQFLGFRRYGDESKLMGLAAHGEPSYLERLREYVWATDELGYELDRSRFARLLTNQPMTWTGGTPVLSRLWTDRMGDDFGPCREPGSELTVRDRDLASSVQARLEEVVLDLLRQLHDRTGSPSLALAGGVALNCVVNGRITTDTPFEEVWIQPAANDGGTSLGAALHVWHAVLGRSRVEPMADAYLGPRFDEAACESAVQGARLHAKRFDDRELVSYVAERLDEGAVVGWFQGRTEFGPRALGNRSILCDPRRPEVRDLLNERIKHRESFRPFAPSILAERTGEWFVDASPAPYMLVARQVRGTRRSEVPAVVHVDGTARLQTVSRDANPRFHDLLAAFEERTSVPMLLNTSFNESEPIVNSPSEAVDCYTRTGMDVLVLGNLVVDRELELDPRRIGRMA